MFIQIFRVGLNIYSLPEYDVDSQFTVWSCFHLRPKWPVFSVHITLACMNSRPSPVFTIKLCLQLSAAYISCISKHVHRLPSNLFYKHIIHLIKFISGVTSLPVSFYNLAHGYMVTLISWRQESHSWVDGDKTGRRQKHRPESESSALPTLENKTPLLNVQRLQNSTYTESSAFKTRPAGEISAICVSPIEKEYIVYHLCGPHNFVKGWLTLYR